MVTLIGLHQMVTSHLLQTLTHRPRRVTRQPAWVTSPPQVLRHKRQSSQTANITSKLPMGSPLLLVVVRVPPRRFWTSIANTKHMTWRRIKTELRQPAWTTKRSCLPASGASPADTPNWLGRGAAALRTGVPKAARSVPTVQSALWYWTCVPACRLRYKMPICRQIDIRKHHVRWNHALVGYAWVIELSRVHLPVQSFWTKFMLILMISPCTDYVQVFPLHVKCAYIAVSFLFQRKIPEYFVA